MKLFKDAEYEVLPLDNFKLFSDLGGADFPHKESERGKEIIKLADEAMEMEIPQLYASVYRLYLINGDRKLYEAPYFKRRVMLKKLVMGEIIQDEGRYVDKIIDILWLILEESSWVIPAHNFGRGGLLEGERKPLPEMNDNHVTYIDLFSGETGVLLAFVYHFMKEKFHKAVPYIINDRIKFLLKERIIKPFLENKNMWWMGYDGRKPNNWNPWIVSSVLGTMALTESDNSVRERVFHKALEVLDHFIGNYREDGGCDEGPDYWIAAASCLFDCLEIIYDLTDGRADYFSNFLIYNMFDYIRKVHITGNYFAAFADCQCQSYKTGLLFGMRMGERTKNRALYDFCASITEDKVSLESRHMVYRNFKDVCYKMKPADDFTPERFDLLPDLQVAVIRKDRFSVAAKGGHNKESHNHNDVANFLLFADGKPVIVEIGKPTYTRDVFSENRYNVFPINSTWHNLPIINGFGEKEGEKFVADSFYADESNIKIGYASAYEKEAGAKCCERDIRVFDDEVKICEKVDSAGGNVIFNYYLCDKPVQDKNSFTFENGTKITFPENVNCTLEEIKLSDNEIIDSWGKDTLYRISLKFENEKNIEFEVKIR